MATLKNAGSVCAVRHCKSKSYFSPKLSFFTFPKESSKARIWAIACQREDLLEKKENALYRNYKVCELHFESKMIVNNYLRKRILSNAVPTIFPPSEGCSGTSAHASRYDHSYTPYAVPPSSFPSSIERQIDNNNLDSGEVEEPPKIRYPQDFALLPSDAAESGSSISNPATQPNEELLSPTISTRTSLSYIATTTNSEKFKDRIKQLEQENRSLKRKIEVLEADTTKRRRNS